MSEFPGSQEEIISYRRQILGTDLWCQITNLCDPGRAKDKGVTPGYHVDIYPATSAFLSDTLQRQLAVGAILDHLESQIVETEIVKEDGRTKKEIKSSFALEIFASNLDRNKGKVSLVIKKVLMQRPIETSLVWAKMSVGRRKADVYQQILIQEKFIPEEAIKQN